MVESDNNPSVFGENVTFTATVSSGAGVPTGSVLFTVDGTPQVSATPLVNGVASLSTSALSVAGSPHTVTADYTSDTGDWSPSSGSVTDQMVTASDSSTVVESDNNPSVFGENVTFTATVSSGAGVPTGSVLFTVDGTPQVSATPLVNGVASLSTSALTCGWEPAHGHRGLHQRHG